MDKTFWDGQGEAVDLPADECALLYPLPKDRRVRSSAAVAMEPVADRPDAHFLVWMAINLLHFG